jgi:hypothetical protein
VKTHYSQHSISIQRCLLGGAGQAILTCLKEEDTWRHSANPRSRPIDRRGWWNDAYIYFELVEIIGCPVISLSPALDFHLILIDLTMFSVTSSRLPIVFVPKPSELAQQTEVIRLFDHSAFQRSEPDAAYQKHCILYP